MKILVTGASGFLGTALCAKLEECGHNVTRLSSKNCDLTKDTSLLKFNEDKYDQIFHLAAWTQAGDFYLTHLGEQWVINQQINTNVLSWWKTFQPQAKMIAIGTCCAYNPSLELKEENYLEGGPDFGLFTYAMTKRMVYVGLKALQKQFGMKYLYLIPSTIYGPGYHTDARQMHFIFDLIRKIMRGKLFGAQVSLWGDGTQKRELIYRDDFIDALLKLNEKYDNEIVNIGSGKEFTMRQYAQLVCDKVGYDFNKIVFDTSKFVGVLSRQLNIEKLKRLVPDWHQTPLDEGLSKTIDWFNVEKDKIFTGEWKD